MQDDKYTYLFPFEKIPPKSKILIYGAGMVGMEYLRQIAMTDYCEALGVLDRAYANHAPLIVPIYPPEKVTELEFDFVVIALNNSQFAADVKTTLQRLNVPGKKILWVGQRTDVELQVENKLSSVSKHYNFAFQKQKKAIALRYPSSIGDAVQRKAVIAEFVKEFNGCIVDIYVSNAKFIGSFFGDIPKLNEIIEDGGELYHRNKKNYLFAIEVRYTLMIDFLNFPLAKELGEKYEKSLETLRRDNDAYDLPIIPLTQNRIQCERAMYNGWKLAQFYNYISFINVQNPVPAIPLNPAFADAWRGLNLDRYIVINAGNSSTSKGNADTNSRSWPRKHWIEFVCRFRERYPDIAVVQVDDGNAEKVEGASRYLFGCDINIIAHVLKNALLYVGTEGGIVHLATGLGTKCVCLFGPTQPELFGYDENINICTKVCNPCYYLTKMPFECFKKQAEPEFMKSITPDMVLVRVGEYFSAQDIA